MIVIFFALYMLVFFTLTLLNVENKREKITKYPSVTLLIPAYNEEEGIRRTIESCLKIDYPGKTKILVVDDASKDNTVKVVEEYKDKVELIKRKKNKGKAAALNEALKKIDTEYFTVIDADSLITKRSLKRAITNFYKKNDEEIGAVICKLKPENEEGSLVQRIQVIEYMFVGLIRTLTAKLRLLHITPGVLSIYKTRIVKEIGGFDEKNLTEDFEIAVQIRKRGYLIDFATESLVLTRTPDTWGKLFKQRLRWFRGFFRTHFKHRDIYFNKKQGLFGFFEFPLNPLGITLFFTAVFVLSFNLYRTLYEFIFMLINTPSLISFELITLQEFILRTNFQLLLPTMFTILITLFIIYLISKYYDTYFFIRKPITKLTTIIIYIMAYNYIYLYIIPKALILELKGKKYDWGTKK